MASSLREQMPQVAAIIDELRLTFGTAYIDSIIRAGMKGQPVFFASENGHTLGTPMPHLADSPTAAAASPGSREARLDRYYYRLKVAAAAAPQAVQTSALAPSLHRQDRKTK